MQPFTYLETMRYGLVEPENKRLFRVRSQNPDSTGDDEIWVEVARDVNGVTKRYIEQFQPRDWGTDDANCWFVDCGLDYNGVDINTVTNLTHLDSETVSVYAEGNDLTDKTVSSSSISLGGQYGKVIAGLSYTSKMETLPITFDTREGTALPYFKQIYNIDFDFLDSGYLKYGSGPDSTLTAYDLMARYGGLLTSDARYEHCKFPLRTANETDNLCRNRQANSFDDTSDDTGFGHSVKIYRTRKNDVEIIFWLWR